MSSISVGSIEVGHYARAFNGGKYWANGQPDSAGGIDVRFFMRNNTEKTIKYMFFHLTPYNRVNDAVSSSIGHQNSQSLKFTGPFEPTREREAYCKNCWYNNSIVSAKLDSVEIEYMDGTTEKLEGNQIEHTSELRNRVIIFGAVILLLVALILG